MQAELQKAWRMMKALEERHKEEMERMCSIQLQYRLAEQNQFSERAVGTAVMQQVVSALLTLPLQSSRWMGARPLTAMLCSLRCSSAARHLLGH